MSNRSRPTAKTLEQLAAYQHSLWRDPAEVASHWEMAGRCDPRLLQYKTRGRFWSVLAEAKITLLLTREYEHLVMALSAGRGGGRISYMSLPHPSGLVADRKGGVIHVASTRNPNQVFDLMPAMGARERSDTPVSPGRGNPLVPVRSRFYPGCVYLHDLALIDGKLYGNSVGENAVAELRDGGQVHRAWWPACIETARGTVHDKNHIQLNSIAAGPDLAGSYFSASSEAVSRRRPGHLNFPVDGRGVVFSGKTREPVLRGLTRPHSARLHQRKLWVDNSGYGQFGFEHAGRLEVVAALPGWTRGLCLHEQVAFVGTSRVIPKFRRYAPGLDVDSSVCGIHAVDIQTGKTLGSLIWPFGNQIFAIDWIPQYLSSGFPWVVGRKPAPNRIKNLFYAFSTQV